MSISEIQENFINGKSIPLLEDKELNYITTPVGNAIYTHYNVERKGPERKGRPRKNDKAKYNDKITCNVCGKIYSRSGATMHKRTSYHTMYKNFNNKLLKIILSKDNNVTTLYNE